jgi:hypothetical protein
MYELGMGMDILPELNAIAAGWSLSWAFWLAASGLLFLGLTLLNLYERRPLGSAQERG